MMVESTFARWRDRIESQLDASLPSPEHAPQRLHQAMRYAVLGGGKRMRPLLVYASGQVFGADEHALDAPAMAVELIHAYSLVHDDLPAMDDDALRRGRATTHIAFDEATAILAGDALQTRAFGLLADAALPALLRVHCLQALTHASGAAGMCGGQALDIDATGHAQPLASLQRMHALKTGALIRAAVRMGALCGDAPQTDLLQLDDFASALGLAFQVRDDILDVEASSEQLGKTAGKDEAQAKSTFPALLGMEQNWPHSANACTTAWPATTNAPMPCVRWGGWRSNAITDAPGGVLAGCGVFAQPLRARSGPLDGRQALAQMSPGRRLRVALLLYFAKDLPAAKRLGVWRVNSGVHARRGSAGRRHSCKTASPPTVATYPPAHRVQRTRGSITKRGSPHSHPASPAPWRPAGPWQNKGGGDGRRPAPGDICTRACRPPRGPDARAMPDRRHTPSPAAKAPIPKYLRVLTRLRARPLPRRGNTQKNARQCRAFFVSTLRD